MKKLFLTALLFLSTLMSSVAQNTWNNYLLVEKTQFFGDVPASYNYVDINNVLSNVGIHFQTLYAYNDEIGFGVNLGIQQIGTTNYFSSMHLPIDLVATYKAWENESEGMLRSFELLATGGGAFIESQPAFYGFSENVGVGGTVTISHESLPRDIKLGIRMSLFADDYIDQKIVEGTSNDAIVKVFASIPLGKSVDTKVSNDVITEYDNTIAALRSNLETANKNASALKTSLNSTKKELVAAQNTLDSLTALLNSISTESEIASNENNKSIGKQRETNEPMYYTIVIGSFESEAKANQYIADLALTELLEVIYIQHLNTYRVIYDEYLSMSKAREDLKMAKSITPNAWISPSRK